jgi:NADH-quinone oxidoreductase subunit N
MEPGFLGTWLDTLQASLNTDLLAFLPELIVCATIVLLLLLRLFTSLDRIHLGGIALALTLAALAASYQQFPSILGEYFHWSGKALPQKGTEIFSGMLAYDDFTIALRIFLYGFAVLLIWLSLLTGIPDREDSADFYSLLLGATLGMSLMASANHLLMVFIAVEMASLPSYALAGFLKGRRQSSEAALKYVVYGGGASGIMLYGISLLAGKFGTAYLPDLAVGFASMFHGTPQSAGPPFDPILLLGVLFVLIGFGFKLAAVPFHFWCPDVFEGASAEVAAFLSVASKGAALGLIARFTLSLAGLAGSTSDYATWLQMAKYFGPALGVAAAVTATFGNLAAYMQTNLKRLLAYSTIAHAGYMLMGLATCTAEGAGAVLFYLIAYLFMNLGAFAIVAFLRNQTGSEELDSFRGLVQRSPLLVVTFGFFLFSLIGVPPLAGFAAKFQIFRVLFDAGGIYSGKAPAVSATMYALLVIGGINTVISLVYYIRVLKVMVLDRPPSEDKDLPAARFRLPLGSAVYATLLAAAVLFFGVDFNLPYKYSEFGIDRFHKVQRPENAPPARGGRGGRRGA